MFLSPPGLPLTRVAVLPHSQSVRRLQVDSALYEQRHGCALGLVEIEHIDSALPLHDSRVCRDGRQFQPLNHRNTTGVYTKVLQFMYRVTYTR